MLTTVATIATFGAAFAAAAYFWLALALVAGKAGAEQGRLNAPALFRAGLLATALWLAATAWRGPFHVLTASAEVARNLVWLAFLFAAFRQKGEKATRAIWFVHAAVGVVNLATLLLYAMRIGRLARGAETGTVSLIAPFDIALHMVIAAGGMVLVDQLVRARRAEGNRPSLLVAGAIAALWAYELNMYIIGALSGEPAKLLMLLHPIFGALCFPGFLMAISRRGSAPIRLSRTVTVRSIMLFAISCYLILMAATAMAAQLLGQNYGELAQTIFLTVAVGIGLVLAASPRVRAWIMVMLAKHFFEHRYDYRSEWMRFTQTIAHKRGGDGSVHQRVTRAVAELAGSPAALLMLPDDRGALRLSDQWQWATARMAFEPLSLRTTHFLQESGRILDLTELRIGEGDDVDRAYVPQWLIDEHKAWVLVPLIHFERMVGAVVLAEPPVARRLDWEDLDVLRIAGQQAASYLAEARMQEELSDVRRFEEFNRRFAFIMHDVKNIASQLGLLAANAERHADKAEFRSDMIETLRFSSGRLNALLARLAQQGARPKADLGEVDVGPVLQRLVAGKQALHPIQIGIDPDCLVHSDAVQIEQIVSHLLQNAIDASPASEPVQALARREGDWVRIDILDRGPGMSAEFIRSKLFKPFVSTKDNGFGLGAFEALNLTHSLGGRLEVESDEGAGSRFALYLPTEAAWRKTQAMADFAAPEPRIVKKEGRAA
ncbi:MAG: system histidine kinase PrsK [Pseudomonadota bacterium]